MTLPIGLSVPHAGLEVPDYIAPNCLLTREQVAADGDVGAAVIYQLAGHVQAFVTTRVARAVLDMNRAPDDRRRDGVVKTHTCWNEVIYREPMPELLAQRLLAEHHVPYHRALSAFRGRVKLGVDCHTMAENGPPVGPDPGSRRPMVCLGDGDGAACDKSWIEALQQCFARYFGGDVTINEPFAGGYITRTHGREMPWVQVELSRSGQQSAVQKREAVLRALSDWCDLDL